MRPKFKKGFSFNDARKAIRAAGGPNVVAEGHNDAFLHWLTRELILFRAEVFRLHVALEEIEKDSMRRGQLPRKKLEASYKRMRDT